MHLDMSKAYENAGVMPTLFKFGDKKAMGNDAIPMTSSDKEDIQKDIDFLGDQFVATVSKFRKLDSQKILNLESRVLFGKKALKTV